MIKVVEMMKNPSRFINAITTRSRLARKALGDSRCLEIQYKATMGKKLNLKDPKTFNEKLQWLKLYDRQPQYSQMVDKYAAKEYVADKIGAQYIIPTLGVYNRFEEINFDELPNQFVLKCTHDSGSYAICKDKKSFDFEKAKKKLNKALSTNYYYSNGEWPYKNVPPRIIAEKFLDDNGHVPVDYKIYCFNGEPYKVMLCLDRDKDEPTKFYSFDFQWNLLRHNIRGKNAPEGFTLPKPQTLNLMYESAKTLSRGIPFVRVDFYDLNGRMYFGEMTFYPDSGFDSGILPEIDDLYGSMIDLKNLNETQQ